MSPVFAAIVGGWGYVIGAYAATWIALGGYWLYLFMHSSFGDNP